MKLSKVFHIFYAGFSKKCDSKALWGGLYGHEQPVTGDVQRVLVQEKLLARARLDAFKALDRFFDLAAARADKIGVQGHGANASFVAARMTGAMSK